jgi:hypothetical protein
VYSAAPLSSAWRVRARFAVGSSLHNAGRFEEKRLFPFCRCNICVSAGVSALMDGARPSVRLLAASPCPLKCCSPKNGESAPLGSYAGRVSGGDRER